MNQYGSSVRTFRARNMFETTITPPNDLVLASATCKRQVLNRYQSQLNIHSNLTIKRLGVFSNFADGLVFKLPAKRVNVTLLCAAYQRTLLSTSFFNITAGSKAVTGGGFTGLADKDLLLFKCGPAPQSHQYFIVDGAPASDVAMNVTDYSDMTAADPGPMYKLSAIPGTVGTHLNFSMISELNYMYEVDQFWSPLTVGSPLMTDLVIIALVNNGLTMQQFDSSNTTFLTKSVDTSFAASAVAFDVVADMEYTPA